MNTAVQIINRNRKEQGMKPAPRCKLCEMGSADYRKLANHAKRQADEIERLKRALGGEASA